MSSYSTNSRLDLLGELRGFIEEAQNLIKDEQWFNIPAPIRTTCEGIIHFNEKLSGKILQNAENSHKKFMNLEDRTRKLE